MAFLDSLRCRRCSFCFRFGFMTMLQSTHFQHHWEDFMAIVHFIPFLIVCFLCFTYLGSSTPSLFPSEACARWKVLWIVVVAVLLEFFFRAALAPIFRDFDEIVRNCGHDLSESQKSDSPHSPKPSLSKIEMSERTKTCTMDSHSYYRKCLVGMREAVHMCCLDHARIWLHKMVVGFWGSLLTSRASRLQPNYKFAWFLAATMKSLASAAFTPPQNLGKAKPPTFRLVDKATSPINQNSILALRSGLKLKDYRTISLFGSWNLVRPQREEDSNSRRAVSEAGSRFLLPNVENYRGPRRGNRMALSLSPVARRDLRPGSQIPSSSAHSDVKHDADYGVHRSRASEASNPAWTAEVFRDLEDTALMQKLITRIKVDLACLKESEGEVSVSAYDTAWVARIPDEHDAAKPQFPKSLDWIVTHQNADGSWGDKLKPWLFDRVVQTLACLVTLERWKFSPASVRRGEKYVQMNAEKLQDEDIVRMPIGFELCCPALLMEAKSLGLNIPYDTEFFLTIQDLRDKKLERIPLHVLHSYPTTMLHTLEGLQDLNVNWLQILKFQSEDGSMCCSPSSTAALYMNTGDSKCLAFLRRALSKFKDAVPTVYPLDTFHNLWVVDTLERLGISRHFETEIEELLASIYKSWSDRQGVCWAKVLKNVPDLDDTSMAFRLLRRHGYSVSAESFKDFQKGKTFVCFAVGQLIQGVSDVLNLFRASQTAYPSERRLEDAEQFSRSFLENILANQKGNADKWSLKTNLSGEIEFALKYPKYKSLERLEIRHYLDMYGPNDSWIGKSIYRLPLVNNADYLRLAKVDFSITQRLHKMEIKQISRWMNDSGIEDSHYINERVVMLSAMFSVEIWEPELSSLRVAVGKFMFIAMALHQLFLHASSKADCLQLVESIRRWDPSKVQGLSESFTSCFAILFNTINQVSCDSQDASTDVPRLAHTWGQLASAFLTEMDCGACSTREEFEKLREIACISSGLEAIALSSVLMSGEVENDDFVTAMEQDPAFLLAASDAIQLARIAAVKKPLGKADAFASMYISFLEELEGRDSTAHSAEQGSQFIKLKKLMQKKLNLYQQELSTVPRIVKRVLLNFTKIGNFFYDDSFEEGAYLELHRVLVDEVK